MKTNLNCSFRALAFVQSDAVGIPDLVRRVEMSVLSLRKDSIYDQQDLGLVQTRCNYFRYIGTVT